jgi:outer membrane biosynthesis protein TonB
MARFLLQSIKNETGITGPVATLNAQPGEVSLQLQIADASRSLEGHEEKLRALDEELNTYSNQRLQYQLLGSICTSLEKLDEMGASDLFWGRESTGYSPEKQLQRVRDGVAEFERKIAAIETQHSGVQADIKKGWIALQLLNDELAELEEETERIRNEFVIVREADVLPFRPLVMPWAEQREDKQRYRKIRLIVLFFGLLVGTGVMLLKAPAEKQKEEIIPERLAELVVKKKPEPKPVEQKPVETETDNAAPGDAAQLPSDVQKARASAESKGVLALKSGFADLMGDSSDSAKMGASARVSRSGNVAAGDAPQRSVIGSQAAGGSGGINTSGLSRQGGTGNGSGVGSGLGGGGFSRVTSNIGGGGGGGGRPLSSGSGPSRTDEEIQIVFDRYKAALYRIYNRELRTNPLLKGKMMLRISIKPDGSVSLCKLESTNMDSPALVKEVVARVEQFNFGPKAGVPTTTILYPIDFLPAN